MPSGFVARSDLTRWRSWSLRDYQKYFLSRRAARLRNQGICEVSSVISDTDLAEFLLPIRRYFETVLLTSSPQVSIQIPAFNEQIELFAALVSYTTIKSTPNLFEIIVADNNSSDRTARIIQGCGARYVFCPDPGVGNARKAAYDAMSPDAEIVFMTDADARLIPPMSPHDAEPASPQMFSIAVEQFSRDPTVLGLSTGAICEDAHWLYRFAKWCSVKLGRSKSLSCWAGCNQFFRRDSLEMIGGINPEIDFGDDHHRHCELARLGKRIKRNVLGANSQPHLTAPVYYSGRRFSSIALLIRHYREVLSRPKLERDEYGYPLHPSAVNWRNVRLGP